MAFRMKTTIETLGDDPSIKKITLTNERGMSVSLCTWGASIYQICVPDRTGKSEKVLLEYQNPSEFLKTNQYFGKTIGRTSGRIGGAKFELNGTTYRLQVNDNDNNLHAGDNGFHNQNFKMSVFRFPLYTRVVFKYISPNGEGGFPGRVKLMVTYTFFRMNNDLHVSYDAISNQDTLLNITNHSYFNLSGDFKDTIHDHRLKLDSERYVAMNEQLVGYSVLPVNRTLDFSVPKKIGKDLNNSVLVDHAWIGYDHTYVRGEKERLVNLKVFEDDNPFAVLYDEKSGRELRVYTDYPAMNVYSDNYPSYKVLANGKEEKRYQAICLEPEFVPFILKDYVLRAQSRYHQKIRYAFKTR